MSNYSPNSANSWSSPQQLCLDLRFSALADATQYLNPKSYGFFSILKKDNSGHFSQSSYSMNKLHAVLGDESEIFQQKDSDFYLSQATFCSPNRKVMNLKEMQLLYMDIDTYRVDIYKKMSPEEMAERFCTLCDIEEIPRPSFIVFSGRGLQAKWIFEKATPRAALVRWRAASDFFNNKMQEYGADPAAKDASRVLRVVGTVNTKSGKLCNIVYQNKDKSGKLVRYDFEYLFQLLPYARSYKGKKEGQRKIKHKRLEGYGLQSLHWTFLEDMRFILAMRGSIQEGMRQRFLMTLLCDMALSGQISTKNFYREAQFIAQQIDSSWTYHSEAFGTVYRKFQDHLAGKKVQWKGKEVTPLYTPSAETRIKWFEITEEEQRLLKVIHSKEIRREFNAAKQIKWQRERGRISLKDYNAERAKSRDFNTAAVRKLSDQGLSQRQIAEKLRVSRALVQKYLRMKEVDTGA